MRLTWVENIHCIFLHHNIFLKNICSYFKDRGFTCKTCQELVQHDALAKQSNSVWNSWAATKCVTGRQRDKRDTRWWQRGQHNMLTTFAHHDKHETSTLRITSYSLLQFPQIPSRGLTRRGGWDEGGFCSKANKYLMKQGWEDWSPMYYYLMSYFGVSKKKLTVKIHNFMTQWWHFY